jgi:trehalose 6-phosphate phosphatase
MARRAVHAAAPGIGIAAELEALRRAPSRPALERKSVAVAIHYRQAPELEALVRAMVADTLHDVGAGRLARQDGRGDQACRRRQGRAIAAFMRMAAIAGRKPLFAGDDVTDEAGFVVVRELGGVGVLVGERATAATVSVTGPPRCVAGCIDPRMLFWRSGRNARSRSPSSIVRNGGLAVNEPATSTAHHPEAPASIPIPTLPAATPIRRYRSA